MNIESALRAALAQEAEQVMAAHPVPSRSIRRVRVRRAATATGALGAVAALIVGGFTVARPEVRESQPPARSPDAAGFVEVAPIYFGDQELTLLAKVHGDEVCVATTLPTSEVICGSPSDAPVAEAVYAGGDVVVYGFAAPAAAMVAARDDRGAAIDRDHAVAPPRALDVNVRFFGFITASTVREVDTYNETIGSLGSASVDISGPSLVDVLEGSTRGDPWSLTIETGDPDALCLLFSHGREDDRLCSARDATIVARTIFGRNHYVYGLVPPGTARAALVESGGESRLDLVPAPSGSDALLFVSPVEDERAVVAYDASGRVVARRELNVVPPFPSRPPELSIASGVRGDLDWTLATNASADQACASLSLGATGGPGGCDPLDTVLSIVRTRGAGAAVFGVVTRAAGRVEVELEEGRRVPTMVWTGLPGFTFDVYLAFLSAEAEGRIRVFGPEGEILEQRPLCVVPRGATASC